MKITFGKKFQSSLLAIKESTWEEIVRQLSTHKQEIKKDNVQQFSACEFKDITSKSKENALRVHFGVLDLDDVTKEQLDFVLNRLALYSYYAYTSFSHTKEKENNNQYRLRVAFPFSKPIEKIQWLTFAKKLHLFFREVPDWSSLADVCHMYHMPAAPNPQEQWVLKNAGLLFNVDQFLNANEESIKEGYVTITDLKELARKSKRKTSEFPREMGIVLEKAIKGEQLAGNGNRDNTYHALAKFLAYSFPTSNPTQVAELFKKSLDAATLEGCDKSTVEKLADKIARAKENQKQLEQQKKEEEIAALGSIIQQAFGRDLNRRHPYTTQELEDFANRANCTLEDFKTRWIIYKGGAYYVFFNGSYLSPVVEKDLLGICNTYLAPAYTAGVILTKEGHNGSKVRKSVTDLIIEYGSPALHIQSSLIAQYSVLDTKSGIFTEATAPLLITDSKYDEEINTFIELLGGESAEQLKDFIASVTLLDRPSAALYIHAPKGFGKNLLVEGLARLWKQTATPTSAIDALDATNYMLSKCPLVHIDEAMPPKFKRDGNTGILREFIQAKTRRLRRLYMDTSELVGCVRLIITANNDGVLDNGEFLSQYDIDAIVERYCYIHNNNPEVAKYLENIRIEKGFGYLDKKIKNGDFARYALWLRDNHVVKNQHRFILSGINTELHKKMTTSTPLSSALCHWLISYLQNPNIVDSQCTVESIMIIDNELLVTTKVLSDKWEQYTTHLKPPTPGRISRAMPSLSKPERVQKWFSGNRVIRYWSIDIDVITSWAEQNNYATKEEILKALSKNTKSNSSIMDSDMPIINEKGETV